MTKQSSPRYPSTRLRNVASLRQSRRDQSDDAMPFVGLENIEPWTGKLLGLGEHVEESASVPQMRQSAGSLFEGGDVLFGKLRPYLGKTWVAEFAGRSTSELLVLRPNGVEPRFLQYVCLSNEFVNAVVASTFGSRMPRADWDAVRDVPIPCPTGNEQHAIVDYLDRETAQLDALMATKERVVALLAERRQALISGAVTRGLDPGAVLRESGIPWLGAIPENWHTERTRWLFKERDERSDTGEEELLTVSHLTGVTPRSQKDVNMFRATTNEGYKICRSGDLAINTMWAWMGAMGVAAQDGIVSPAYNVYEPAACLDPSYVDALVRLPAFAREATRHSTGVWSSRLRLYPDGFFAISIPVPPLSEQREIVARIEEKTRKLEKLHTATRRTIDLLKERREALISEAVSGQLDVARVG